ncbi:MAG: aminopeptidase P family N-terminal domain-containing protein, partial [Chloroflexota bacterium]
MSNRKKHQLIEIEWPTYAPSQRPPKFSLATFETRLNNVQEAMDKKGLSHLLVYADREHSANLAYLTNFDPRFEEALLIISQENTPLLVVGNECAGYLPISPLHTANKMRNELYQPFSLLNQPRDKSRTIKEILASEGIEKQSQVGCIGWKYMEPNEQPNAQFAIEIPAYIVDACRELSSWEQVTNASDILMHPDHGLRATCTVEEIAYFEYTNFLAAEGMKNLLFGLREGIIDFEAAQLANYNGEPLGCHPTFSTGNNWQNGLCSPSGQTIQRGVPLSTNISYWGSNCCRSGWIAEGAKDLPAAAQDYAENFAGVYFEVMNEWFKLMQVGTNGGTISDLIEDNLPFDKFGIFLNPGHLIHYDEWLSSPIFPNSPYALRSGMVMQVDVIPFSTVYGSTRMEDTIVIADSQLQAQLKEQFSDVYGRCIARR